MHLNRLSLRLKLFSFSAASIALLVLITILAQSYYSKISQANLLKEEVSDMSAMVLRAKITEKTYQQFRTDTLKNQFNQGIKEVGSAFSNFQHDIFEDGENKQHIGKISQNINAYQNLFEQTTINYTNHTAIKEKMAVPHATSENLLNEILRSLESEQAELQMMGEDLSPQKLELLNITRDCKITILKLSSIQNRFLDMGDVKMFEEYIANKEKNISVGGCFSDLKEFSLNIDNQDFVRASEEIISHLDQAVAYMSQSNDFFSEYDIIIPKLDEVGDEILVTSSIISKTVAEYADGIKTQASIILLSIIGGGVALFMILSVFIVNSIVRPVSSVVDGLKNASDMVSQASSQVSASSQTVASGASEQSSSIDQISASLEEMASMTRQDADNATQANSMAKETLGTAGQGAQAMKKMSEAIEKIKISGDETAKIIKTIDEIAFQTNLLALNAAVEAARAGEAGAGFAVVAEEVRNLAQRSAAAAKDTSVLIEESQGNSEHGVRVSQEVDDHLSQIVEQVGKVTNLISEVNTATVEQSQGIEQINNEIVQLDSVTKSNSSNAEESASAGIELSTQANTLEDMVSSLTAVVDGRTASTTHFIQHQQDEEGQGQGDQNLHQGNTLLR